MPSRFVPISGYFCILDRQQGGRLIPSPSQAKKRWYVFINLFLITYRNNSARDKWLEYGWTETDPPSPTPSSTELTTLWTVYFDIEVKTSGHDDTKEMRSALNASIFLFRLENTVNITEVNITTGNYTFVTFWILLPIFVWGFALFPPPPPQKDQDNCVQWLNQLQSRPVYLSYVFMITPLKMQYIHLLLWRSTISKAHKIKFKMWSKSFFSHIGIVQCCMVNGKFLKNNMQIKITTSNTLAYLLVMSTWKCIKISRYIHASYL